MSHPCDVCGEDVEICNHPQDIRYADTDATPRIRPSRNRTRKIWALGISSDGFIPSGESFRAFGTAQLAFQPSGFIIPYNIADRFIIDSIRIGNRLAVAVSADPLPGDLFKVRIEDLDKFDVALCDGSSRLVCIEVGQPSALVHGREWAFPLLHPGMSFGIFGTNISSIPTVFRAAFIGTVPHKEW